MEVTKGRDILSGDSGHQINEASVNTNESEKEVDESDFSSGIPKEQFSSSRQENVEEKRNNLERVSSVEYTRNTEYDDVAKCDDLKQTRFALWRAQADQDMIKCIKEDDTHHTYFTQPPVNNISLFFKDNLTEKDYRKKAWQSREERRLSNEQSAGIMMTGNDQSSPQRHQPRTTWSPSGFTAMFDLVVSMFTFIIICVGNC